VVRYATKEEAVAENIRLVEQVYAELHADQPAGLRYLTLRLDDGFTFVHMSLSEGDDNPLFSTAAFTEFQRGLGERLVAPPESRRATIVGSYGF
jgi:hypothetical protein